MSKNFAVYRSRTTLKVNQKQNHVKNLNRLTQVYYLPVGEAVNPDNPENKQKSVRILFISGKIEVKIKISCKFMQDRRTGVLYLTSLKKFAKKIFRRQTMLKWSKMNSH